MAEDYLTLESEQVRDLLAMIDQAEDTLQQVDKNYRPPVGAESNLTGKEVCNLLHISPRTLQTLRDKRQIPFVALSDRNILYPEAAIREMLAKNYRPAQDP